MDGPKSLADYINIFRGRTQPPSLSRSTDSDRLDYYAYLESMDEAWRNEVTRFACALPPLKPSTRVVALIPARNEEHRIGHCLSALADDVQVSAAKDWFEVVVLENGMPGELGGTRAGIYTWIDENRPCFRVHVISQEWAPTERAPLAKARKILADVTIARAADADMRGPLYLLSEDADIERVECGRLGSVLRLLDAHPGIDAVRGPQDRTTRALRANHLALLERRSWQITELLLSASTLWPENNSDANFFWNRVVTAGSNVFFSAQVYSQIRGYSLDVPVFEDMDIGQRISVLRGRWCGSRFVPCVGSIRRIPFREESNIARILHALSRTEHVYQHDGSTFYTVDGVIKQQHAVDAYLSVLAPYSRVTPANRQRFENILAELSNEVHRILHGKACAVTIMRRVMHMLGFRQADYRMLRNEGISVVNWAGFAGLAERFSARRDVPSWYCRRGAISSRRHTLISRCLYYKGGEHAPQ